MTLSPAIGGGISPKAQTNYLSNFILGSQDGLVNVLGILLGLTAATADLKLIFVAAFAALGAESISMGAVAYTSTLARRKQYLKGAELENRRIEANSPLEKSEVREIFGKWGYRGKKLEQATDMIVKNPKAWLAFMMSYELNAEPVPESEPRSSFLVVLASTVFGSFIPLIPYFLLGGSILASAASSIILSGCLLFFIGYYEARTTIGSLWRSGLQMTIIGLASGVAGFLIGRLVGALP
ncbi:MAG TPA: VIT1/CCC1 transporter family protein [Nitrososphaerales archaeon]|nr:VIT1/CCC1 transporter family protein [Nitrososphaerales archaeon]